MAKELKTITDRNPAMMLVISFFVVTVVNMIVFWLGNTLFPQNIVLGTMSLTYPWALTLSAATISLLTVLAIPFLREWEQKINRDLQPMEMMASYLVINFVGLWLLTRASEVFGLGISSWVFVLGLAVILDVVQGMVMMSVDKMRK